MRETKTELWGADVLKNNFICAKKKICDLTLSRFWIIIAFLLDFYVWKRSPFLIFYLNNSWCIVKVLVQGWESRTDGDEYREWR